MRIRTAFTLKNHISKAVNASSGIVFLFGECNYLLLLTYLVSITVVYHSKKTLPILYYYHIASTTCQPFFGIQSLMLFSDCLHHLYSIYMLYLLFLYIFTQCSSKSFTNLYFRFLINLIRKIAIFRPQQGKNYNP